MMRPKIILPTLAALAATASACGGASDPLDPAQNASEGTIVVGSANFPENVILGEIYAKALEDAGFDVARKLNIGAREVIYQQVENCSLSVVPEYNQALLSFVDPETTAKGTDIVDAALAEALPASLTVLNSSAAQDNNAVAVTKETAEQYDLTAIPDLADVAPDLVFGGPTEWQARPDGYAGLREHYGVEFKEYRVLDYSGPITISALDKGDIGAALLFSTTPQIAENDYVVLDDPDTVVGVNNILPLICKEAVNDEAVDVLNQISAELTTEDLTAMNKAYSIDKADADGVAEAWLDENLPDN